MFNLLIPAAVGAALTRLSPLSASRRGAVRMMGSFGAAQDSFRYTGRVRPGKRSPTREVPPSIVRPDYAGDGRPKARGPLLPWQIEVKSEKDIEGMRAAGRVAREVLDAAARAVEVGVATDEIDRVVHDETTKRGAYPSPLNYHGFPKSCCTSVNEVICHGIPDASILRDGDIINVDVTCYYGGYHGDCSETFLVGQVDDAGRQLVKVTYDCWQAAIDYCKPGQPYSGIGAIIEQAIAPYGYSTVREFCGHGIGTIFHTNPNILHYKNNEPGTMEVGHVFTIGACQRLLKRGPALPPAPSTRSRQVCSAPRSHLRPRRAHDLRGHLPPCDVERRMDGHHQRRLAFCAVRAHAAGYAHGCGGTHWQAAHFAAILLGGRRLRCPRPCQSSRLQRACGHAGVGKGWLRGCACEGQGEEGGKEEEEVSGLENGTFFKTCWLLLVLVLLPHDVVRSGTARRPA
tara:strand:- start:42 stop:1415 length:1374 start_codon:yes stop_codon:yes gene_type:complete